MFTADGSRPAPSIQHIAATTGLEVGACLKVVREELARHFASSGNFEAVDVYVSAEAMHQTISAKVRARYASEPDFRAGCAGKHAFAYLTAMVRQWVSRDMYHEMPEFYRMLPAGFRVGLPIEPRRRAGL